MLVYYCYFETFIFYYKVQATSNFRCSILVKKFFNAFFLIARVKNMPKNTFPKNNILLWAQGSTLAKNQFLGKKKSFTPIFVLLFSNKAHQTTYLLLIRSISVDSSRKYCNNHKNSNDFYIIRHSFGRWFQKKCQKNIWMTFSRYIGAQS